MKAEEIRQLDEPRLQETLTKLHAEWRDLRFEEAVGKLTQTARIREIRKSIARIHTIRTERAIAAAVEAGDPLRPRRRKR
jgi:large subunit ribosomal protein L29